MLVSYLVFASALLWLGQAEEVDYECHEGHLYGTKCFVEQNDDKNFDDAAVSCEVMGGSLLRPKSAAIANFLKGKLNILYRYWVGVKSYEGYGNWEFTDRTPVTDYHPWMVGEPNNWMGNENCIHVSGANMNWNDFKCDKVSSYICEVPAQRVCPQGWHLTPTDHTCIKVYSQAGMSWDEGREFCRGMGGDLLTVENQGTQDLAKGMLEEDILYWIGMRDLCEDRNFLNLEMLPIGPYLSWKKREPNNYANREYCVEMESPGVGSWNDRPCGRKSGVICQLK